MTRTALLPPRVEKEFRALLPVWTASLATIVVCTTTSARELQVAGALAYALGTTTLGALAIGHEYSYRTLGQLLAQPAHRRRILRTKMAVLAVMLAALAAAASLMFRHVPTLEAANGTAAIDRAWAWTIVLLSLLAGLTVAPWLTMQFRNPIAGVVFTVAIPAALWVVHALVEGFRHGWNLAPGDSGVGLLVIWAGVIALSATAAVLGRRKFFELEAIEGQSELRLSPFESERERSALAEGAGHDSRPRRAFALLVQKELRLQSISLVVAFLFVVVRAGMTLSRMPPDIAESLGGGVTAIYVLLVSVFVGSIASAEERGFGTIGWQILQPMTFWKQWGIKVVTAVALAMTLAILVPYAIQQLSPVLGIESIRRLRPGRLMGSVWYISSINRTWMVVPLCTCCALYVSSLCTSALRALLLTFPFVTIMNMGVNWMWLGANHIFSTFLDIQSISRTVAYDRNSKFTGMDWRWLRETDFWIPITLAFGFIVLLLAFAARNHRSAEHGWTLARRQMGWIVAYAAVAAFLLGAVPLIAFWALATY